MECVADAVVDESVGELREYWESFVEPFVVDKEMAAPFAENGAPTGNVAATSGNGEFRDDGDGEE